MLQNASASAALWTEAMLSKETPTSYKAGLTNPKWLRICKAVNTIYVPRAQGALRLVPTHATERVSAAEAAIFKSAAVGA